MGELGAMLGLAKSSLTGLVDRTERNGLVRREPDPRDLRAVRVALTAEGSRWSRSSTPRPAGGSTGCRRGSATPSAVRSPICSAGSCWTTRSRWCSRSPAKGPPGSAETVDGCCGSWHELIWFVSRTETCRGRVQNDECYGSGHR
ncbi:MarR family winged helix-turn-helix transcriptional regulator [Actinomadura luteofluorescens]|uniref:MarR family winged helix-turn-helix transcriptional regulator n=1 Tax=Actinomadura luteofluorescens TaxID=46163 RepID=UPI003635F686